MNGKEEEFDLKKSIDMKARIKKLDNMIKMVCQLRLNEYHEYPLIIFL